MKTGSPPTKRRQVMHHSEGKRWLKEQKDEDGWQESSAST